MEVVVGVGMQAFWTFMPLHNTQNLRTYARASCCFDLSCSIWWRR